RRSGLTAPAFLCAIYVEVLRGWSRNPAFTLNLTSAFRTPFHPRVQELVGDFTSTYLLEVDGQGVTFADRARRIHERLLVHATRQRHLPSGVHVLKELSRRQGRVGAA